MKHDRGVTDAAIDPTAPKMEPETEPETASEFDPAVFDPAAPVVPGPQPVSFDEFGTRFVDLILHRDRVMESINRVLGEDFTLGPIGAGPGRRVAKVMASGTFGTAYGEPLSDAIGYRVNLPVKVAFDLDLQVDTMRFNADVLLPLRLTMELIEPLTILWHITPPREEEVVMQVAAEKVRSAMLQRLTGLDGEMRRFIVRFVQRELEKPHVRKAMHINLVDLIDNAWEHIAEQFLPNGPDDRG